MKKAIDHLRGNVVAYLALFVALGGTSYAAISIPRGSVGTVQLRNGAVTGSKLAKGSVTSTKLGKGTVAPANLSRSISGYVGFWARIDPSGHVIASSEPASTTGWTSGIGAITIAGTALSGCLPLATASGISPEYVSITSGVISGNTVFDASMSTPEALNVVDICP
jgi:hypothetical protein